MTVFHGYLLKDGTPTIPKVMQAVLLSTKQAPLFSYSCDAIRQGNVGQLLASHGDDYFRPCVPCFDITNCFRKSIQWILSVNGWHNLAGL